MCRSLAQGCRELGEPVSEVKRNCQVDDCSSYWWVLVCAGFGRAGQHLAGASAPFVAAR